MKFVIVLIVTAGIGAFSQEQQAPPERSASVSMPSAPPGYVLGPGDQFVLEISDLEELNGKTHRIDNDGTVTLPLVGRIQAAGLTLPPLLLAWSRRTKSVTASSVGASRRKEFDSDATSVACPTPS